MNKGIEAIKTLRTVNQREFGNDENVNNSLDIIEKELKALKIIKNKEVDVKLMAWAGKSVEAYNVYVRKNYWRREELTQEEFDLLREVLSDE